MIKNSLVVQYYTDMSEQELMIASCCHTLQIIIKFPYNARSDWLKQRALSENRARVDNGKLASKFLLWNFDKFDPN